MGLRIALPYLVLASLWILVSDWFVARAPSVEEMKALQTAKGMLFVVASTLLVYYLGARQERRARADLAEVTRTREQLRRAQALGHLGSWEVDLATGRLSWSDQVFEIFGITRESFAGTEEAFFEFIHPDDRETLLRARAAWLDEGGDFDLVHRIVRPTGEVRWVRERARVVHDSDGTPRFTTGTVQDVTERELNLRELERLGLRLRALNERLLEIQENERRHIGLELHDTLGSSLTTLRLRLQMAAREETSAAQREEHLDVAMRVAEEAIHATRNLSRDLLPPQLESLGLVRALCAHLERQAEQADLEVERDVPDALPGRDPVTETACFRIIQEAMTNVVRHAGASRVRLVAGVDDGCVRLCLSDDGQGFSMETYLARDPEARHIGLAGMEERARMIGARLDVDSMPGAGTTVCLELPDAEGG
ncbi:MAG: PAS domain-containing protein [Gammaproteobacteria bacterium]|nr:PAS domain-containing protein [Gammaproteobacteria bacterium]